jgi:hypothetical protein
MDRCLSPMGAREIAWLLPISQGDHRRFLVLAARSEVAQLVEEVPHYEMNLRDKARYQTVTCRT